MNTLHDLYAMKPDQLVVFLDIEDEFQIRLVDSRHITFSDGVRSWSLPPLPPSRSTREKTSLSVCSREMKQQTHITTRLSDIHLQNENETCQNNFMTNLLDEDC